MDYFGSFWLRFKHRIRQASVLGDEKRPILSLTLAIIIAACLVTGAVMAFFAMESYPTVFLLGAVCGAAWLMNRAGYTTAASIVLISVLLVILQVNIFAGLGIHDVAITAWPAIIFFTGLLFGWRAIPFFTALVIGLAAYTRFSPNGQNFTGPADTADMITLQIILAVFSAVAIVMLRNSERSRQAARSSDERFRQIFDSINDAIFIQDADTTLTLDVNQKALAMFGSTREEVTRLNFCSIASGAPPYTSENAAGLVKKAIAEGPQQIKWQVRDSGGRVFWVDASLNLTTLGGRPQVLVTLRDISEHEQTVEAQSIAEANFRAIFENATVGIFQSTPDGRFRAVNPAMARIYGYDSPQDMLDSITDIGSQIYVDPHARGKFKQLLAAHGEVTDFHGENYHKTGSIIWTVTSARVVKDKEDQILYFEGFITDITERRQAEENLRESEARYRFIAENTADVIWVIDVRTEAITYASPSVQTMLGYTPEEIHALPISDILAPDVYSHVIALIRERLAEIQPPNGSQRELTAKLKLYRKDGVLISVEASITLITDPQGALLEIVGVARDITENMRSENALRESEEKYRQLVEGAPNGIIVYEYNRITYANPAAVALLRASAEGDLLGIPPLSLVHPIDREAVLQRMKTARTAAAATTLNHEKWFGFDGRIIDVEVKAIPISSQGEGAIQLIVQDINERLQAEQAIRESEERFRAVVQTANDAIITTDQTGKIVSWNFAAENIFHYSPGQIIGLPVTCIVPDQANILRQPEPADENHAGKIVEVTGLTREGKEFPIEMSITEWKARGGDFLTVIIRDITERKRRENELRVIASLSAALRTARSRTELLSVAVNHMNSQLQYGSIATEIINHETRESVIEAASGAWASFAGSRQAISQGPNFILRGTTSGQSVDRSRRETSAVVHTEAGDQIIEGVGIPLVAQEQLIGMLWVGKSQEIPEAEEHLLASIADIIANALLRTTLHEQTLKDALEITHAYDTTLEGWAHALELRDQETVVHSQNVVEMTIELARVMGVAENEIDNVRRGALLHDIGKMGIPDSVLLKPGTLNEREWEIMRRHPEYGYKLLEPIEYLLPAIDIPYCHHERWDGTGYPRGLQAEEIPLVARIFAIVDVWDALLTDRPYRKAWDIDQACKYLQEQAGKHFDPRVVDAFMHAIVKPMQPPAQ